MSNMFLLDEPEDTEIELTRGVIDSYIDKWEQELKENYKRQTTSYPLVFLQKLGEFRSSRWYQSFLFSQSANVDNSYKGFVFPR